MGQSNKGFSIQGIAFSALFSALMVAMSWLQITLPFSPVPITLENMAVMLAGAILGARYGFFSIFTVVFLVALGLPLLHGNGGLPLILGPTGGFIWMFPISAMVTGWFVSRIKGSNVAAYVKTFIAVALSSLLVYVTGVPWLAYKLDVSFAKAMALGCYPFLIGDGLKALATAAITIPIRQVFSSRRMLSGHRTSDVVKLDDDV